MWDGITRSISASREAAPTTLSIASRSLGSGPIWRERKDSASKIIRHLKFKSGDRHAARICDTFKKKMSLSLTVLCLALTSAAWAQTSLVSGALDGSVSDASGGRIPGAVVTAQYTATQRTREASTNGEGVFRFAELPAGVYEIS